MTVDMMARVTHEAYRVLCAELGDNSQLPWDQLEQYKKDSTIAAVQAAINAFKEGRPMAPWSEHERWRTERADAGWVHGETKDVDAKTHPDMVPFNQLPKPQQARSYFTTGIMNSLINCYLDHFIR